MADMSEIDKRFDIHEIPSWSALSAIFIVVILRAASLPAVMKLLS